MSSPLSERVLALLEEIEGDTRRFADASGLACPAGCGLCCTTPAVEVHLLEMLPMAEEIHRRGEAEQWLARAGDPEQPGLCLAYEHDPAAPERGRCSMYAWRASICRLYAYAGRRGKRGEMQFVACPVHEEQLPEATERAYALVEQGFPIPVYFKGRLSIAALEPALAGALMPIRRALIEALHHVGLRHALDPDDDPKRPPTAPRRAA